MSAKNGGSPLNFPTPSVKAYSATYKLIMLKIIDTKYTNPLINTNLSLHRKTRGGGRVDNSPSTA